MSKTALIVDDSKIATLAIKKALSEHGYSTVEIVHNGEDAVSKYKDFKADLVTMDINMPNLDGINATRQILDFDPECDIIVITELNLSEEQKTQLKGVREIVMKPVTVEKITAAVTKL